VTEPDAALASLVDGELVEVDDAVEAPDEAPDEVPDEALAVLDVNIEVPPLVDIESTSPVEVGGAASREHPAASVSAKQEAIAKQITRPLGAESTRTEPRIADGGWGRSLA